MKFIVSSFVFALLDIVIATRYILVPKDNSLADHHVASFYNLEPLATFDNELFIYTSHHDQLHKHRNVLSQLYDIEEDQQVNLESVSVPWHLDRIARKKLPLNNSFPYSGKHSCHENPDVIIDTYVVDTGIQIEHPQFESRAQWGANFADDKDTDCNNHGTHVSGLIGSKDYGACVDANLIAVKVLDCDGSGTLSGVIKGIEWVFLKHLEKSKAQPQKTVKSIINMSLGGGFSKAVNKAVDTCINKDNHFYIVVAAGNENKDACFSSPASAASAITVMASDSEDNNAWFSNWGPCANIYAPGVNLLSTIPGGTDVYSGTSMASPVVAGVLNHYIDLYPQHNQQQMLGILEKLSSKNVINSKKQNTKNNLVYLTRNA
jgi:hypothetical protein